MGLNDIELPPFLITQLFSKSLIESAEMSGNTSVAQSKNLDSLENKSEHNLWKHLGNNKKNILLVLLQKDVVNLPDHQLDFLIQLLKACQLSLNDVAIINLNNYVDVTYEKILSHFSSRTILLFGVSTAAFGFPFEIPAYQIQTFTAYTVLHAPELASLQNDKSAKSKLWASLKKLFNL